MSGPGSPARAGARPLVRLERCTARHGDRLVLRDIDLDIFPGGHLAITGANGSGKSTLLRLIAGELWPAPEGPGRRTYDFGAGPEDDAVGARRRIRLVSAAAQDRYRELGVDPAGGDLVASGFDDSPILRRDLTAAQRRQVRKCLLRVGAADLASRRWSTLSRGEQRRLLIARALVSAPVILCLDEVGDGLDAAGRDRLGELLGLIAGPDLTLVMATHHEDEIPPCVTRRLALAGGRRVPAPGPATGHADVPPPRPLPGGAVRIRVARADVYRGGRRVLRGIDWCLRAGEHWLIRGGNGAGKSTFLALLYGSLRPAAGGSIAWFDLPPDPDVWQLRRRIARVSDELQAEYLDRLTVRDCVATGFVASIGRVPVLDDAQWATVDQWISVVGLADLATAGIRTLSYGQFRRALIARALVTDPEVLLLDEPASGLDREGQAQLGGILRAAAARGAQIVLSTHRDNPAGSLVNRVADLVEGRLVTRPPGGP